MSGTSSVRLEFHRAEFRDEGSTLKLSVLLVTGSFQCAVNCSFAASMVPILALLSMTRACLDGSGADRRARDTCPKRRSFCPIRLLYLLTSLRIARNGTYALSCFLANSSNLSRPFASSARRTPCLLLHD